MAVKQFLALCAQTVRNAIPGTPTWFAWKVTGKLEPEPDYTEGAVPEWSGADTRQGFTADERTSAAWKFALESRIYPTADLVTFLTYLNGNATTPVALDAPDDDALRVIFSSASVMYDSPDAALLEKALCLAPHTGYGGNTVCQKFTGGRPMDGKFTFEGGKAAMMTLNFKGGPWIGDPEQTAVIADPDFSTLPQAFWSVPKIYLGAGATLTGTAPNYTDIAPGTMALAKPDGLTLTLNNNIDDVIKMNGEEGPSVTEEKGQVNDMVEFAIDFADPASGWSSYDAWKARFAGVDYTPVMVVVEGRAVITVGGTIKPTLVWYWPAMKINNDPVDRKNDGTRPKVNFKLESRVDATVNTARYMKLIY